MCSGIRAAVTQRSLPRKLMGDFTMCRHLASVSKSGLCKGGIKPKRSEATRDTVLIGSGQKKLLGNIGGRVVYGLGMQHGAKGYESDNRRNHSSLPSIYARLMHGDAIMPGGLHEGDSRFGTSTEGIPL